MKLSVFERLLLLNILPAEGDMTTLRIIRQMKEDLSFTEEEHKALEFDMGEGGSVRWKADADTMKDVPIGEKGQDIIKEQLVKANDQKKLQLQHMALYERFVEGKEPEAQINGQTGKPIPEKAAVGG